MGPHISPRDRRRAELNQLWHDDPSKIVGMFRHATGLNEFGRLPDGATVASVVNAIVDDEQTHGRLTEDSSRD